MTRLSSVARHVVAPDGIVSTGWPAVRDTCAQLGISFDQWQDGSGRLILAKRADGLYAADTAAMSIPRQVGKTYMVGGMVFALCLITPGTTAIWTAHRFKLARETFDSMKAMARQPKIWPHIENIRSGSGEEAIHFRNGSRILFGARENGFGLGFTKVGILVLDEAQRLTSKAMDDLVPTTNAHPNPLILMTGTPPRPTDTGDIFSLLRHEAISGESEDTLYIEFSADRNCDPMDRSQWRKANPSYPSRTSERSILRMARRLTLDSFMREGLGIWDEVSKHEPVVRSSVWETLVDVGPEDGRRPSALAVDMSHAREISIAACWLDGSDAHCEEVWAGVDAESALEWLAQRARYRVPVVIDQMSPANSFLPLLRKRRLNVVQTTAGDMAKACGTFIDKVSGDRLTHADQQALNDSLKGARKRPIGKAGGWGWDRADETVNIAPLVAATLALYGATTNARAPRGDRSTIEGRAAQL